MRHLSDFGDWEQKKAEQRSPALRGRLGLTDTSTLFRQYVPTSKRGVLVAETQKSSLCGILGYAKAEERLVGSGSFRFPQTLGIVKRALTKYTIKVIFLSMKWTVEFLNATAEAEVDRLPHDMRAVLTRITNFIEEYGLENVGMPYVRHVQGKVWELRLKGRDGIARSLYVSATGCRVVILRTFIKKTPKTPHEELQLALKRAKEIL